MLHVLRTCFSQLAALYLCMTLDSGKVKTVKGTVTLKMFDLLKISVEASIKMFSIGELRWVFL